MQVTQLTGFSDPVYAEAYVNVNQYDIVLDVLIVNQTADTLQNLTLELATLGTLTKHAVCLTLTCLEADQACHSSFTCLEQIRHAILHTHTRHAILHSLVGSKLGVPFFTHTPGMPFTHLSGAN